MLPPEQGDKAKTGKAHVTCIRQTAPINSEDQRQEKSESSNKMEGTGGQKDLDEREKKMLERMSAIMKSTLDDSLSDFKQLIATEMAGISKKNDENVTKLKKDMSSKLKTLEGAVTQQKNTIDRIPHLEESVKRINDLLTKDAQNDLNRCLRPRQD